MKIEQKKIWKLFNELKQIPGGYEYDGCASIQICFPLRNDGELRFGVYDEDPPDTLSIDLYDGALPPGITGPVKLTAPTTGSEV